MSRFREDGLPPATTSRPVGPIRITEDEAADSHVDDLLKRQASLQGDTGISRDRSRRWYYSNWFVFALTGGLFATLSWLILEPIYSDTLHFKTAITSIEPVRDLEMPRFTATASLDPRAQMPGMPIPVRFAITNDTVLMRADGTLETDIDPSELELDAEIGIHVSETFVEAPDGASVLMPVAAIEETPSRGAFNSMESAYDLSNGINLIFFALVAALVGLGIGAADGMMCRLMRRALLCGFAGLLVGFVGGFVSSMLANVVYGLISMAASEMTDSTGELTTLGFLTQLAGRSLGWALAGMTMGLGQGLVLRSGKLFLYGFLGGLIGGLLGGLLFDPIQKFLVPETAISAHWARLVGIVVVGTFVGLMIGIVELLARDAWLNMIRGPLAGKEFLIFKDLVRVGAAPSSDIYLFNDDDVAQQHATIRAVADNYEIEAVEHNKVLVNGRPITRTKLRHGDKITLGSTEFAFQKRKAG